MCALSHGGQFGLGILFEVFSVLVNIDNSNVMQKDAIQQKFSEESVVLCKEMGF